MKLFNNEKKEINDKKSMYQVIEEAMENGMLPKNFSLPDEQKEGIKFADGAMDGICIYHTMMSQPSEEKKEELAMIIRSIMTKSEEEVDEAVKDFTKKNRVITIIDGIQRAIIENKNALDPGKVHDYALHLLLQSGDRESVKFGMAILELFQSDENMKKIIRTVGISDEFTIFSVFIMRDWENSSYEIFDLAQKISGWGRIHAIDFLDPVDKKMKDWLLTDGVKNTVLASYSALTVFQKADVMQRIEKEVVSKEELSGILGVMDAMLEEGPVQGISTLEDPKGVLEKVLVHTKGQELSKEEMEIVDRIKDLVLCQDLAQNKMRSSAS